MGGFWKWEGHGKPVFAGRAGRVVRVLGRRVCLAQGQGLEVSCYAEFLPLMSGWITE